MHNRCTHTRNLKLYRQKLTRSWPMCSQFCPATNAYLSDVIGLFSFVFEVCPPPADHSWSRYLTSSQRSAPFLLHETIFRSLFFVVGLVVGGSFLAKQYWPFSEVPFKRVRTKKRQRRKSTALQKQFGCCIGNALQYLTNSPNMSPHCSYHDSTTKCLFSCRLRLND